MPYSARLAKLAPNVFVSPQSTPDSRGRPRCTTRTHVTRLRLRISLQPSWPSSLSRLGPSGAAASCPCAVGDTTVGQGDRRPGVLVMHTERADSRASTAADVVAGGDPWGAEGTAGRR
jgi:hypothetical protein